jgi:hypothetical protein
VLEFGITSIDCEFYMISARTMGMAYETPSTAPRREMEMRAIAISGILPYAILE